jgi:hypothetical protein
LRYFTALCYGLLSKTSKLISLFIKIDSNKKER